MAETEQGGLMTAVDVGRLLNRSTSSVKRMAAELSLDVVRTPFGTRLFHAGHVEKLRAEIVRRAREAGR